MKFRYCIASLMVSGLIMGCKPSSTTNSRSPSDQTIKIDSLPATDEGEHDHAAHGPHGGEIIELGGEEYHAELVHDAKSVTIHILDSAANQNAPISAPTLTINMLHDGKPEQFKLAAAPESTDPSGKSSRFTLADNHLAEHIDEESAAAKLVVEIDGMSYRAELAHDHDHEGHDHEGHDHDGHDHDHP